VKPTHSRAYRVRRYDIDPAGRLQAPILCRLLQETAGAHAAELGVAIETVSDRVWARRELAELDISYHSECHHGQTLVSISQTAETDGGCVVRHQIARRDDGVVVALARTVWRSLT